MYDSNRGYVIETIRLAWPAVLESFFIALAGMIDTMMVSSLGTYAVAAIGLTIQPKFITLAFFFAINVATSALIARRKGENDQGQANKVFLTTIAISFLICFVLSFISIYFADDLMRICGSNADTHTYAVTYFRIIQGGMFFNVMTMAINAAQRGGGNTRIAMVTNVVSSLVNICFNYLLIGGHFGFPAWGLFGAALATVLGTVVSSVMALVSILHKDGFISVLFMWKNKILPSIAMVKSIWRLAYNLLLENFAMRIGFITTSFIAARLGTDIFAAHQVGMNYLSIGFSFGDGMQVAAVALIGRSLGEKNYDLAKLYGKICQRIGLCISVVLACLIFFFAKDMFLIFFDDLELLDEGLLIMRYIMVIIMFQISQVIYGGCLRGAGDVKYCLFASLLSVTIIRSMTTWSLTSLLPLGLHGIWIGVLSDQVSRFVLLRKRFKENAWTNIYI